ncbi:MAG: ribosome maturation factor RimM [Propionibacteriaceae bacterium]|jgi:16S rRNA processing protein RimM|nr:ribosome maturation factor RimM [Propionibacteriaceae bacterium]
MIEVRLGRVERAHGLAGEVAVTVWTDVAERRFAPGAAVTASHPGPDAPASAGLTVADSRLHGRRLLVRFAEVADRTAAEALLGAELTAAVDPDEPAGDAEEFFDHQLRGLTAVDAAGGRLGVVADVVHGSAQDLVAVATPAGRRLVPFVKALVPVVDLAAGRLVVADLPGLLDEPAAADGGSVPAAADGPVPADGQAAADGPAPT